MSCTKIIIWSAIFINDIWILANPHQNWIVHVWTAKDSWRTLEYSWNDYFGILPTATIQDTSNFKANNHLNRNKSSVLKQYIEILNFRPIWFSIVGQVCPTYKILLPSKMDNKIHSPLPFPCHKKRRCKHLLFNGGNDEARTRDLMRDRGFKS